MRRSWGRDETLVQVLRRPDGGALRSRHVRLGDGWLQVMWPRLVGWPRASYPSLRKSRQQGKLAVLGLAQVSLPRFASRVDSTQRAIVAALRKAGVRVFVIGRPVDLLTYHRGRWQPLECKPTTHKRGRADQAEQEAVLAECAIPKVRTAEEALKAVGLVT